MEIKDYRIPSISYLIGKKLINLVIFKTLNNIKN